jgi:siroheme decarboxylase
MELNVSDLALLEALARGLPLVPRPYAALGAPLGLEEEQVIARIWALLDAGFVKRLGVVVRHRELGYRANAMVVWDVPDDRVSDVGRCMATLPFVTLCYRRPRRPPDWPYNLFCMIHGRERRRVEAQVDTLAAALDLADVPRAVLFSARCFRQRGARYGRTSPVASLEAAE